MPLTVRILDSLHSVPAQTWDALIGDEHPFVRHAFLAGLEQHGCLRPAYGWTPQHVTIWDGATLLGATPGYRKTNSHGEFVFDHAWAQAYQQHGLMYFPKWLGAVPYSPVTGPRLLARSDAGRSALLAAIEDMTRELNWSSAHVNFHTETEDVLFDERWLQRIDVQYHWRNFVGWKSFDDFLSAMDHKRRKNIRQERARLAREGVSFRVVHGHQARDEELAVMHRFYLGTFRDYGNTPALTLDFLRHLARTLPDRLVLVLAERGGELIAGALCLRGGDTLYGRYWGSNTPLPGLHFETCYYQGIDYCLREGLRRFEPGAQGEHKLARGFLPTLVRSRHWIADTEFSAAIAAWCREERAAVRHYVNTLRQRSPFRDPVGP